MKRILGIVTVLGLVGALTVLAQEVKPGKVDVIDFGEDIKLEMVLVPAGRFGMGVRLQKKDKEEFKKKWKEALKKDLKKELGKEELDLVEGLVKKFTEERRQYEVTHEVTLTKPFYMGKYEVTQEQYEAVMGKNPSDTKGAKLPVTVVSWNDCQEFIKKLNAKTNGGYRLPTEAEWEFACRAGTTTAHSFGHKITPKDANYAGSKIARPVAVGSYKANAFGLYDMHGNVYEWCEDWIGDYPAGGVTDPKGPASATEYSKDPKGGRVLRGGAFKSPFFYEDLTPDFFGLSFVNINEFRELQLSSGNRDFLAPTDGYSYTGFRLAKTP